MAWIKIESSVARNRKFVKAGPAPSWLWVCGLAYCQEGLTDGFIPKEALMYLGVKNAVRLAGHLVTAGLWHVEGGGWRVNDYLKHNRSAADVADVVEQKRAAGKNGGRPKKDQSEKHSAKHTGNHDGFREKTIAVAVSGAEAVAVVDPIRETAPIDAWFYKVQNGLYPAHRVTRNHHTALAFCEQMQGFAGGPVEAWRVFQDTLDINQHSHEWRVKGMIPWLENYIAKGLWQNALPADAAVGERLTKTTNRTLAAGAEVLNRKPA